MSETATRRIMNGLQELKDFAEGRGGPLTLYVPDGRDGLEARVVQNMDEYNSILSGEFQRILAAAKGEDDGRA